MTAKDRIACVFSGNIPDRVPIVCNLLEQGADELGVSIEEYYSQGSLVAEGQLRLQEHYGYDHLWAYHHTATFTNMLGSKRVIYAKDGPPNVGDLIIKSEKDIHDLIIDDSIAESRDFKELMKTVTMLKQAKGEELPVMGLIVGSFSLPPILMGMEAWLDLLYSDREDLVRELLEKCSEFSRFLIKAYFEAGVDILAYSNPLSTATFITVEQFKQMALPWVKRDISPSGCDNLVYFNGGGILNPMLETLVEQTDFSCYYLNPKDSISEAKRIIGTKGVIAGTINDMPLTHMDETTIRATVKKIMREGSKNGRFIYGTLVMPYKIPKKSIEIMMEAALTEGVY